MTFEIGSDIAVREVLHGRTWAHWSETVVGDGEVLATVLVSGTSLAFPDHTVPHPWGHLSAWQGTTVLKLRREGDWYSVWKFFEGGRFTGWYVNFEQPVTRRDDGVEVDDLQLDIVVAPDGSWRWKDVEDLGPAVASGRMSVDHLVAVLDATPDVVRRLETDDRWWAPWDDWTPVDD